MASTTCSASSPCAAGVGSSSSSLAVAALFTALAVTIALLPTVWRLSGATLGCYLRRRTAGHRQGLLAMMAADEQRFQAALAAKGPAGGTPSSHAPPDSGKGANDDGWESIDADTAGSAGNGKTATDDWDGIVGFFHPFCNAGGGGERVLWAAIRATQQRWPRAKCFVYTGDHDAHKDAILARVRDRFNIHLHPPTVTFLYLSTRHWVLASTWPRFTLAGQSFGSVVMAWDALSLLVPDIFVDTMGYAFALGFVKLLFPGGRALLPFLPAGRGLPTAAYVHYPTISTDMLASLDPASAVGGQGVNAGQGAGLRGRAKRAYWQLFARLYAAVGASVDVVMTNSSWTQAHIQALWGPQRAKKQRRMNAGAASDIAVVYPPVAVRELEQEIDVSARSEAAREPVLLYIAQFRPEKNHLLIVQAFAQFLQAREASSSGPPGPRPRLVLIGSVRDDSDKKRVYQLRLLVDELHIRDAVDFQTDAPWPAVLDWLRRAAVGVNGMWNEHFGIGVVEYQAAGLVAVVHDSGGPKLDIVTDVQDDGAGDCSGGAGPTGFHATTADEFAAAFAQALALPDPLAWRLRARRSARRFTEETFARKWVAQMERLVYA